MYVFCILSFSLVCQQQKVSLFNYLFFYLGWRMLQHQTPLHPLLAAAYIDVRSHLSARDRPSIPALNDSRHFRNFDASTFIRIRHMLCDSCRNDPDKKNPQKIDVRSLYFIFQSHLTTAKSLTFYIPFFLNFATLQHQTPLLRLLAAGYIDVRSYRFLCHLPMLHSTSCAHFHPKRRP